MKKLFIILAIVALALNATAQDIYIVGYYNDDDGTIAALYKNGERLYTAHHPEQSSKATRVACNSQGDIYWWIDYYNYPSNEYSHSELLINNQTYATTENHREIHVTDIYCLNDTLYYTGYQYNEDSVMVAMVWKGADFATHWVMGDGIHPSYIRNVDVDKHTGIPYFCGYVINDKKRAAIWEAQELLNTFDQDSLNLYEEITQSNATKIAVANGHVYTIGSFDTDWPENLSAIWEDNLLMHYYGPYEPTIHDLCTFEDSYYSAIADRWGDGILKNGQDQMLWIGYAFTMLSSLKGLYVIGEDFDYKYYVWKDFEKQFQIKDCDAINDACVFDQFFELHPEWYYEIQNDDGSSTFQHLKAESDTTINNERPTVIVRSNTQYDRDSVFTMVTHEYVYEKNGKVYWWNNDLLEFTTLYDLTAEVGDEWTIKVGTESITMHVNSVGYYEYKGLNYRTLHVSDENNLFTGDIVYGIGHLTSFFPERLMSRSADFSVNGLRCYWEDEVLLYHNGDEDCDAIYAQIHAGVDETSEDTAFAVYPNPTDDILFVETQHFASLPDQTYRITNLVGQTILSGNISAETQQINIKNLPSGMYFITVGGKTVKFVVK